jgi:trans-2,3-dihydro-3-hydroxyanthranilate isomerase
MPMFSYVVTDVFTDRPYGGNPLAVLPEALGLSGTQMQAIAREFNLSETTFVTPGTGANRFKVRIFTPEGELPFAGHPTVGTALVLQELGRTSGREIVLELGVGPVRVELGDGEAVFFREGPAEVEGLADLRGAIEAALGVELSSDPWQASYGTGFVMAEVADMATVGRARVRIDLWEKLAPRFWRPMVLVHAVTGAESVHARMFAPTMGVAEDPATGSAAAAYVGSVARGDGVHRIDITQGVEMGRPSLIRATVARVGGEVTGISIGGGAVTVAEGRLLRLP